MDQHITRQEFWYGIYQDWRDSRISRTAYYDTVLQKQWPSNIPFPSKSTFLRGMRQSSQIEPAQLKYQTSQPVDCQLGNLRIVEVGKEQLQQTQFDVLQQQPVARNLNPKICRMRFPNGTMIEFETDQPEALAIQIAALAGRSE